MRRATFLTVFVLALGVLSPAGAQTAVEQRGVSYTVHNVADPGLELTVRGTMYRPEGCLSSVMLLVHGLSYGQWGWDFPIEPEKYSVAQALAGAGYAAVTIDLPGYGASDDPPSGYTLTVEGYAMMVGEIVAQLRAQGFQHVGLMGHSAGAEISELAAALYDVDVLIAAGYTHFPSQRIVTDFITGDMVRAAQDDYEYFGGTPDVRLEYMYNRDFADPVIQAKDNELANLTPSGEVYSIGPQPSRYLVPLITEPTLLLLAEKDLLFPVENGEQDLLLFALASDKSLHVVPEAGHSFMLHPNAPATNAAVAAWLAPRIPACA